MEHIYNSTVIWFIIGFLLFLLEFALPGFILFFFAVGAWVVSIISLLVDISVSSQLGIFIATSLITVLLFRNWIKNQINKKKGDSAELEDEFVGKTATTQTAILPGKHGKVVFKGTTWDAESDEEIEANTQVIITGYRSIVLIVKSK
jgi:membrane protein implicated in regulation of membrane protease activity